MAATVRPFLMFQGNAEEAMDFYVATIPNSEIKEIKRYPAGAPGREGSVMKAVFTVAGQPVLCTDSVVKHDFSFTPSFSMFLECDSLEQIAQLFAALSAEGVVHMPLGDYGFSRQFAWINDRFGVSWQLNLP